MSVPMSKPTTSGTAPRTILITGAAGGLGRAFAEGFAAAGEQVAVADINLEGARETADLLTAAGARAQAFQVDVTSAESTRALATAVAEFGGGSIDVVVNNAAIYASVTRSPWRISILMNGIWSWVSTSRAPGW